MSLQGRFKHQSLFFKFCIGSKFLIFPTFLRPFENVMVIAFMLSSFRQQTQQNFSNSFRMSFRHSFKLES